VAALLVGASIVGASVPLLAGSLRSREPGQPITGGIGPGASAGNEDPLAFFQTRVREDPSNLTARLDLAHRYVDAGRVREAAGEYAAALRLDPGSAEARAHVGLILFLAGRAGDGLRQVREALGSDATYPEAWFIEGVILVKGLSRNAAGERALERYLQLAPFGAERDTARALLKAIAKEAATPAGR
jgi:Tfp pilus assembly protein PilF